MPMRSSTGWMSKGKGEWDKRPFPREMWGLWARIITYNHPYIHHYYYHPPCIFTLSLP